MSSSKCDWSDSPLSTTGNVVGILTFLVAVAASALAYWNIVRSAEQERDGAMNELRTWLDRVEGISNHPGHVTAAEREARERRDRWLRMAFASATRVSRLIVQSYRAMKAEAAIKDSNGRLLGPARFLASWRPARYLSTLGWLRVRKEVMEQISRLQAVDSDLMLGTMNGLGRQNAAMAMEIKELRNLCIETNRLIQRFAAGSLRSKDHATKDGRKLKQPGCQERRQSI